MKHLPLTIARNSLFSLLGQITVKALSVVFAIFVVRRLGDTGYGLYTTALAYVGMFAILSDLGLAPYMVREVAKDSERTPALFANAVLLRLMLSAGTLVVIVGSALALKRSPELVLGTALAACTLFIYAVEGPMESLFIARERLDFLSLMNVTQQMGFVVLGTMALVGGLGFVGLLVASLGSLMLATAIGWRLLQRTGGAPWRPQPRLWLTLLRAALPFGVIGFSLGLSYKVDTVLLQYFYGDAVTGWYNAAYNLIFLLMMVSHAVNLALYPALCRQHAADPKRMPALYTQALKYLFVIAIPIAVGTTVLAKPLIHLLYTDQFAPSVLPLQILIWVLPLMFLTELLGNVTIIHDQEKKVARALLVSTAVNVALNLVLIPRWGLLAASAVTVLTEMILAGQYLWLLRRELATVDFRAVFFKPGLAAGLMGVAVFLARGMNFFLVVPLGAAIYLGLLTLTGSVGRQEAVLLGDLVRRRAGSREVP
ncbi:MAG: flippase [Thermoflexales bacterium]|nr:flippase [Thermoflexales bacterium]